MLTGLWHRAVSRGNNQDSAIHLSSASNHVLDIVSMTWAVNVRIVAVCGVVFNVCSVDGNAAFFFFRCLINGVICLIFSSTVHRQNLGDCSGQSRLAVVNVANGANVYVRQGAVKFFLCHFG